MQEILQNLTIEERIDFVAKERFAWPGCYALGLVLADGECICAACVVKNLAHIKEDTREKWSEYQAVAAYVSDCDDDAGEWNDGFAVECVECNRPISDATTQEG